MSHPQLRPYTAEDLLRPEFYDRHVELIRGEIVEMSPTHYKHGWVIGKLIRLLSAGIFQLGDERREDLLVTGAEAGFRVTKDPDTVLAPGLAIFDSQDPSFTPGGEPDFFPKAPPVAIEVLSPSNTCREMSEKVALYMAGGAQQVWTVDPATEVIELNYAGEPMSSQFRRGDTIECTGILEGIKIPVAKVFD